MKGAILKDLGHHEEALIALSQALELDPNNPDLYEDLGDVLDWLGRDEEADQAFSSARELNWTDR